MQIEFSGPIQLSLDVANIIMFTVAFAAVFLSWWQYKRGRDREVAIDNSIKERSLLEMAEDRKLSNLEAARRVYNEYMRMAYENPRFSMGVYDEGNAEEVEKYDIFLSMMLYAFDDMIALDQTEWERSAVYQVGRHERYIRKYLHKDNPPETNYRESYSPTILKVIDEMLEEKDRERIAQKTDRLST